MKVREVYLIVVKIMRMGWAIKYLKQLLVVFCIGKLGLIKYGRAFRLG